MVAVLKVAIIVLAFAFVLIQIITYFGGTGTRETAGIYGQVVPTGKTEKFCDDSDNGFNINKKGVCNSPNANGEDFCDGNVVNEYVCKEFKCTSVKFRCPFGCQNGACLES